MDQIQTDTQPQPVPTVPPVPLPAPPVAPPPVPQNTPASPASGQYIYAGFGSRWLASALDGLIVGAVSLAIGFSGTIVNLFVGGAGNSIGNSTANVGVSLIGMLISILGGILQMAVWVGYYTYFTGKNGQTPGKKALNIKVINPDTTFPPGYGYAFLREVIGKPISSFCFGLGYLWVLWDDKKQTWHDKIAHTVVIKV